MEKGLVRAAFRDAQAIVRAMTTSHRAGGFVSQVDPTAVNPTLLTDVTPPT